MFIESESSEHLSNRPLVSVIAPVYRIRPEYLISSIESMLRQTYKQLEILLIDDGSPDNCGEICEQYARKDARVRVIHQKNCGVSAARNAGLNLAIGEYIAFVDPDDYLEEGYIDILMQNMKEEADIIACCCTVHGDNFIKEDHFFSDDRFFYARTESKTSDDKNNLYLQLMDSQYGQTGKAYTAIGVPWGKLYRAEFIRRSCLQFDTRLTRMQDNMFNMYAFYAAGMVQYIDLPVYHYRFEHMEKYSRSSELRYILIPFMNARNDCLVQTGLMEDPQIREAYLEEVLEYFVTILYQDIFRRKPPCTGKERREVLTELENNLQIQDMLRNCSPGSFRRKLYWFLAHWHMYDAFGILSRLSLFRHRKEPS